MKELNKVRDYCIYKYVSLQDGSVLYVGKTDSSLKQRIDAHAKEEKFMPYLGNVEIFYFTLSNRVETDIVEKYLINQLKPALNEKDMEEGLSLSGLKLPKWEPYSKYESERKKDKEEFKRREELAMQNLSLYLDALDGLPSGGVFYSRILHPTGILPFLGERIQMTEADVFEENTKKGRVYRQHLTENAIRILTEMPHLLEVSIYREIYQETDEFDGTYPYQKLWDFCDRMTEFMKNRYEAEDSLEQFLLTIPKDAGEIIPFFREAFEGEWISNDHGYVELNERGCLMVPAFQEKIAKLECREYENMGLLREETKDFSEISDWDFGF